MSSLSFNEVVFLDDFFRSEENGLESHPLNRRFLRGLFYSACQASGIATREEYPASDGGRIPVGELMDALELPRSIDGWARAAIDDLQPALEKSGLLPFGKKSLVIGWGLPPSLLNYIDARGATFIDVEVHPLRFARHLHLGVRTNSRRIATIFSQIAVPDEIFRNAAIGMKALFARRGDRALFSPGLRVGVFLGQTNIDLALICNGRLVGPTDVLDRVAALASSVDVMAVKPHPCQVGTELLDELIGKIPNAMLVDKNTYAMFCAENVAFFSGISSGALTEAEYFGHRAERVAEQDRNNPALLPAACSEWFPVGSEVASLRVMKDVLERSYLPAFFIPKRRYAEAVSSADSETIDVAFGMRWGLQLDAAGLRSSPAVGLNEEIRFGSTDPYVAMLTTGWHEPEPWGVWSSDEKATLLLVLDKDALPPEAQVRLLFTGVPYQPAGAEPPMIELRVNGERCECTQRSGAPMVFSCEFEVEPLRDRPLLMVEFSIAGALRPCDVSDSADARTLGFGLHTLFVTAVPRPALAGEERDGPSGAAQEPVSIRRVG